MDDHHVVKQHHLQHAPCSSGGRRPRGTQGLARTLCELDWTCVFVIIVLGISTAAVNRRAPVRRPIYVWDAATAYPHQPNSVPFWVAIAAPAAVLLAYSSAVELWALRSHQTWRRGALQLANVLLALLAALAATGFLTELFKRICGRLRPDFLARCGASAEPATPLPVGAFPPVSCAAPWSHELADGMMSFPSGHSSCSMAVGLFGALYVLWCAHWRHGSATSPAAASAARGGGAGRGSAAAASSGRWSVGLWARREAARLGVLLLVLLLAAWPWGVAVSRFRDNRHNVSDVVAGLLLGACFAPLFFGRLLVQRRDWDALLAAEEAHAAEQQQQGGGGACGAAGGALGCSASGAPATSHGPVLPIVAPGHISSSNGGRHAVV